MHCATSSLNFKPFWTERVFASRKSGSGKSIVVLMEFNLHFYALLKKYFLWVQVFIHRTRYELKARRRTCSFLRNRKHSKPQFLQLRRKGFGPDVVGFRRKVKEIREELLVERAFGVHEFRVDVQELDALAVG